MYTALVKFPSRSFCSKTLCRYPVGVPFRSYTSILDIGLSKCFIGRLSIVLFLVLLKDFQKKKKKEKSFSKLVI